MLESDPVTIRETTHSSQKNVFFGLREMQELVLIVSSPELVMLDHSIEIKTLGAQVFHTPESLFGKEVMQRTGFGARSYSIGFTRDRNLIAERIPVKNHSWKPPAPQVV
jgi:hypothetical protein